MRLPLILLTPLLLLSGCSHSNYYSDKLELPTLVAPQKSAAIDKDDSDSLDFVISPIEKAQTPSQADEAINKVAGATALTSLFDVEPDWKDTSPLAEKKRARTEEVGHMMAYLDQAARIKKAQLEDGDSRDSTGEVAQRTNYALQSHANIAQLTSGIPAASDSVPSNSTPEPTETTAAPSSVLGMPTPTPTEESFGQATPSDTPPI